MAIRFKRDRRDAAKDAMNDGPETTRSSGDGGSWYLDAVGASVASMPASPRVWPRHTDDEDGDDETPYAGATSSAATVEMTGAAWRAKGEPDPLADWRPEELSRTVGRRRNFRWSIATALALVVALVAAAVIWVPRIVQRQADAKAAEYTSALVALRAELPDAQQILATLTEPSTEPEALSGLAPDLAKLQTAADEVARQAVAPLPDPLPLMPRGPIDALQPSRDAMGRAATDASAIVTQITDGITYRTLAATLLAGLPELPSEADPATISDLNVRLSEIYADATGTLAELPELEAFADHRDQAGAAVDTFFGLQVDYIDALRNGDAATAARLADQITRLSQQLQSALVPGLAELRSGVDTMILALDRTLSDTINDLPD